MADTKNAIMNDTHVDRLDEGGYTLSTPPAYFGQYGTFFSKAEFPRKAV